MSAEEKIRDVLQELEGGDLVTGFVVIAKTTVADDPDATAYRHYWSGGMDERLGLLRYATLRTEAHLGEPG